MSGPAPVPAWSGRVAPARTAAARPRRRRAAQLLALVFTVTAAQPFPSSGPVVFAVGVGAFAVTWWQLRLARPSWLVTAFLGWCVLSAGWSVSLPLTVRGVLVTGATVLAVTSLVRSLRAPDVLWALALTTKVLTALSWVVYLAVPTIGREQVAYQQGAFRGVFVQRNSAAFVLAVGVLTLMVVAATAPAGRARRGALSWLAAVFAALVLTSSGTGLVVTVASAGLLGALLVLRRRSAVVKRTVIALAGLTAVAAAVNAAALLTLVTGSLGRDDTLTGRTVIWAAVEPTIAMRPWTGHGWGALWVVGVPLTERMWDRAHFEFPHAHNSYLDLLAQIGAVGLVLVLLVALAALTRATRAIARPDLDAAPQWAFAVTTLLLLYGVAEQSFVSYYGLLLLVTAATMTERRRTPTAAAEVSPAGAGRDRAAPRR